MPDRSGKFTKKVLSLLIALCLLVTILPAVTAEGRDVPFAAKLAAGTVFYADQDLKTETGTLAKEAVVLVTEEKGKADHISYKLEGKTAQSWIPKEAAATILAATPTDLAPYLPDENLTLTPPAVQEEASDTTPTEGDEVPPTVILSEGEAGGEGEPSTTDSVGNLVEGEVIGNEQSPWDGAATIDDAVSPSEPLSDGETTEGDPASAVIPSEVEESLDNPSVPTDEPTGEENPADPSVILSEGEAGVEESPSQPLSNGETTEGDPTPATPTDLEPYNGPYALGSIDKEAWDELLSQETAAQDETTESSDENQQPAITYTVEDGELVAAVYIPSFIGIDNITVGTELELPPIRNQNPYGTCWAFSAIGGMEIDLIKDGESTDINLSEFFLLYFAAHNFEYPNGGMGKDNITAVVYDPEDENYLDIGGNNIMAYRILANLIGTTSEEDNPYPEYDRTNQDKEPTSYNIAAQLTGAYLVNPEEQQTIKDMIQEHGSIGASIYMISTVNEIVTVSSGSTVRGYVGYNSSTFAMYGTVSGKNRTNHDILLVGWDDDFASTNFLPGLQPPGNGAWLVRNSWGGKGYGLNGYFWISYYDSSIQEKNLTAYDAINDTNEMDEYAYSYDKAPYPYEYHPFNDQAVLRQTFTVHGQEQIQAIGVETGCDKLDVSVTVTAGSVSAEGSVNNVRKGFYRIPLKTPIPLSEDTVVTVEVTYKPSAGNTNSTILVPYQPVGPDSIGSISGKYQYTAGIDGGGFTINGESFPGDPCIKIYTRSNGDVKVTGLTLVSTDIPAQAQVNKTYHMNVRIVPENATNKHIYWSSSDTSVATVDQNGTITTGNKDGVAVITATTASGGYKQSCTVTIPRKEPTSLYIKGFNGASTYTINNDNAGSFWYGSKLTIGVGFNPDYATERDVDWSSSNRNVLDFISQNPDGSAVFKAIAAGSTTITVRHYNIEKDQYISANIQIILDLHKRVTSVSLDRTSVSIQTDDRLKLNATISPSDAENKGVIWTSSNSAVASVDGAGNIYGQSYGTAVITVTTMDGSKTAACTVEVSPRDPVEAFVFRLYRVCLLRDPDETGFRYWVNQLNNGKETGASAVFGFYHSNEMKGRNYPNDQYLTRAYEGIMGRAPDAGGFNYWIGQMEAGVSRAYLISGFLTSNEFDALCRSYGINKGSYSSSEPRDQNVGVTGFISRLYTKLLGRMYDDNGLNYWCSIVLKDPVRATLLKVALDGFLHSNEFLNAHLDDTHYLMVLYRAFLGREADINGLNYWLGNLRSGMTRDKVAEGFASSNEFKNIMASYGFTK